MHISEELHDAFRVSGCLDVRWGATMPASLGRSVSSRLEITLRNFCQLNGRVPNYIWRKERLMQREEDMEY